MSARVFTPEHRDRLSAAHAKLRAARNAERLEDVTWMALTGECLTGAAKRLGIGPESLRSWCRRHAPELGQRLADREPRDPNQRPGIEAMRTRRRG